MSLNTLNFNRHTWAGGQVITSQLLNRIEAGILDVTNALSTSNTFINGLNYTNNGGNVLKTVTNITQTEGKIAVTYANIQSASTSQKGVTQLSSTIGSTSELLAATPLNVTNSIAAIVRTDDRNATTKGQQYAQSITQSNGQVTVSYANFSPILGSVAGDGTNAQKLNISVANNVSTDVYLTKASTSIFGVTKLQSTATNDEDVAATPKAIYDTIRTLIGSGTLNANFTPSTMPDGTSDNHLATTQFVMNAFKYNDAMVFKGTIAGGSPTSAYTPAAESGHTYKVSSAGLINGIQVEAGDMLICTSDNTIPATAANVETISNYWSIVQTNLDGTVIGPANAVDLHIPVFDGTSGKLIKDSGFTIGISVPSNAVFTDTTYSAGTGISFSGTTINNTGVLSVTAGSDIGEIEVNNTTITVPGVTAATSSTVGLVKLYTETGDNSDGAISQSATTELFASLVENFGLTLLMPSTVTWDTEDGLTATVDTFEEDTTVVIQKYANGGWITYNGEARTEGEHFRAYCTRELFGQSRSQVIGSEYVEPAPPQEPEPEEEPEEP